MKNATHYICISCGYTGETHDVPLRDIKCHQCGKSKGSVYKAKQCVICSFYGDTSYVRATTLIKSKCKKHQHMKFCNGCGEPVSWSLLVEDGICVTCQMDRISQGKDTLAEMYEDISSHSRVYIDEN